jgi:hypothetical protein
MTRAAWLAGLLLIAAGCSTSPRTASVPADSTDVERGTREREMGARLNAARARLDSLKTEATQVGSKVDDAVTQKIAELEIEKDSAQVNFDRLKDTGREKWEDVRTGFAVMLDSLDVKIDRARANLHRRS